MFTINGLQLFFLMVAFHYLMDTILQSDTVAQNKNRRTIPKGYNPDIHGARQCVWPYFLTGHALSHGLAVFFVTQSFTCFFIETISHWLIDFGKGEKLYGIHTDQALHLSFKVFYLYLIQVGLS